MSDITFKYKWPYVYSNELDTSAINDTINRISEDSEYLRGDAVEQRQILRTLLISLDTLKYWRENLNLLIGVIHVFSKVIERNAKLTEILLTVLEEYDKFVNVDTFATRRGLVFRIYSDICQIVRFNPEIFEEAKNLDSWVFHNILMTIRGI